MSDFNPKERICVSVGVATKEECVAALKHYALVEIRADLLLFKPDFKELCSLPAKTIVTCRPAPNETVEQRKDRIDLLEGAINSGATYIDVELESPRDYRTTVVAMARKSGCKIIVSSHEEGSSPGELSARLAECLSHNPDIAKIACPVDGPKSVAAVMSLYQIDAPLVVFGTGAAGKLSRVMAPFLGAAFTFAYPDGAKPTAEGQFAYSELLDLLIELSARL